MKTLYTCPVCGYAEMSDPVEEGNICPCCGTEFGYDDDLGVTYQQLRQLWIDHGCPWFSNSTRMPSNWEPIVQLLEADLDFAMPVEEVTTKSRTDRVDGPRFEALVA